MSEKPSEELFRRGVAALDQHHHFEALGYFKTAVDLEKQGQASGLRTKYSSYLGLALTLAHGGSEEGQRLCEQAVQRDFMDADLFCNLGIVYLRTRQKKLGFEAFRKAIELKPGHKRTLAEWGRYERRNAPVLAFLARAHWLNRMLGRLRHRRRGRSAKGSEARV